MAWVLPVCFSDAHVVSFACQGARLLCACSKCKHVDELLAALGLRAASNPI
jgi:hypothetical protein